MSEQYKEFRFPDPDPEYASLEYWDDVYSVLSTGRFYGTSNGVPEATRSWVINAHEPSVAFTVYEEEVDHYITILNWIKEQVEEKK